MFSFLKPKQSVIASFGTPNRGNLTPPKSEIRELRSEILKLDGLHCSSCAVNIDLALEDLPGVTAKTNYAKSETKIEFDSSQVTLDQIHFVIRDLGYQIL